MPKIKENCSHCPACKSTGLDFSGACGRPVCCPTCNWQGLRDKVLDSHQADCSPEAPGPDDFEMEQQK